MSEHVALLFVILLVRCTNFLAAQTLLVKLANCCELEGVFFILGDVSDVSLQQYFTLQCPCVTSKSHCESHSTDPFYFYWCEFYQI